LAARPEGRRPIWDDNIKINLQEMVQGLGLDGSCSGLGQVAGVVNVVINFRVSQSAGNLLNC
jgi:hypothetical protein